MVSGVAVSTGAKSRGEGRERGYWKLKGGALQTTYAQSAGGIGSPLVLVMMPMVAVMVGSKLSFVGGRAGGPTCPAQYALKKTKIAARVLRISAAISAVMAGPGDGPQ